MLQASINYWAVLVSGVAAMVVGSIWYTPKLFGNMWMSLIGKTTDQLKAEWNGTMMLQTFVTALVMFYILAHFIDYTGATTLGEGAQTGLWLWLGFVATTMYTNILYEKRPVKLWAINAGYQLVNLIVAGAILSIWQ